MSKQAIIYTRYSPRPNAKDCDSCARQAERCRAYCKQHGYNVKALISDEAKSGGILNRPGLMEAINFLKPDHGEVLIVDSSDRLARDPAVAYAILAQIEAVGARVEYANGQPADPSPEGKLIQGIFILLAAYERDRIRLRTKQGLDRKRKNGEKLGGKIPIGWRRDVNNARKLVRCEQERDAILDMFCLHLPSEACAEFITKQHGLCRGKPWSARTIRKIIKREAYWACPIHGDLNLEPTHP